MKRLASIAFAGILVFGGTRALQAVSYEYDWSQSSGSPTYTGKILLNASSGSGLVAALVSNSGVIVSYDIKDPTSGFEYTPGNSTIQTPYASISWNPTRITSLTLNILLNGIPDSLTVTEGSITSHNLDPFGSWNAPESSSTAVLLAIAGVALGICGRLTRPSTQLAPAVVRC